MRSEDGWAEVASMETDVDGAYRFDGLPMVDGNDKPYLYRVRSYMPDGKEWVAINVGSDENNDSDWGEAANSVVGAGGRVGITPAMSVLGAFQTVRTTPNAYGQKFNLLVPYNWVPEDGRSVDLGMTGDADAWRTLVFTTPWGTRLFYVKLPQTGDELLPWMVGLALFAASVTDESYGVNTARFAEGNWSVDRALMVNLFSQSSWTISNIVGCAVGAAVDIPVPIAAFAMTAIFICLLVTQKFTSANIVAMIVAMLGVYLCKAFGLTGPAILIGAIAGVVCALAFSALFPRRPVTASAPGTDPVGGDLGRPSTSEDASPHEDGERR